MAELTGGETAAWASRLVRGFAAATNLLIAGRRFGIHGSGTRADALATLLRAIGARPAENR